MNEIRHQVDGLIAHSSKPQHVVGTHGSCVRSIRLISKQVDELTSWQLTDHWIGRTNRASLHADNKYIHPIN
ncbi:hypothetical protein [Segatella maculosa]|uniref:hypothetical protein n=1 Tax=Segatella maculosa TaxID=439703 RepID=UPI001B7FD534|nr:hypothetical protein [Segatella maculosa]